MELPDNTVEAPTNGTMQSVVGESSYQDILRRLFEEYEQEDGTADAWAVLVPEPHNRSDPGAVAVVVDDATVGYLPRVAASSIQAGLLRLEKHSGKRLSCRCIISGFDNLGVRLDMDLGATSKWLEQDRHKPEERGKSSNAAGCCGSIVGYALAIFLGLSIIVFAIKWAIGLARSLV